MAPRILNQSSFDTLIEDLLTDLDDSGERPKSRPTLSLQGLSAAWDLRPVAAAASQSSKNSKSTNINEPFSLAVGDFPKSRAAVLAALGLRGDSSEAEIGNARREFALRNHPDKVPGELKETATRRMMIVNEILDRHLAERRRRARA